MVCTNLKFSIVLRTKREENLDREKIVQKHVFSQKWKSLNLKIRQTLNYEIALAVQSLNKSSAKEKDTQETV